jgi:hypothetical protein
MSRKGINESDPLRPTGCSLPQTITQNKEITVAAGGISDVFESFSADFRPFGRGFGPAQDIALASRAEGGRCFGLPPLRWLIDGEGAGEPEWIAIAFLAATRGP